MYSAFRRRSVLLAMMSCARVCPFKSVGCSFETILVTRLRTRRCDCSFVLAYPVQTSVGELGSSSRCGKVGALQRFQAEGVFSALFHEVSAFVVGW
jgi:hypothetical protein